MVDRTVVAPAELAIHLTYRCPLKCSHCCFSSDMSRRGHLDPDIAARVVDDAAAIDSIERINFVGGDPFLHADAMAETLARAKNQGLQGSATTSAYWAKSERKALDVLTALVEAGLDRLIISYDDMHAEFLDIGHVVNAYRAARQLNVAVCIAVVMQPGSRIDAAQIRQALGASADADPDLIVYETAISSTGRALDNAGEAELAARRGAAQVYRGACESALRDFSVTPEGRVMPCCGVLPFREAMVVGDVRREPLQAAVERAYNDVALKWIALEGPVALLCEITSDSDRPYKADDFDGVCHACDVLYSSPVLLARLAEYLPRKIEMLEIAETVLAAVGRFRPRDATLAPVLNQRDAAHATPNE